MKKKYIDLHCHPFKEYFNNPKEIIKNAYELGITKMFVVGTDLNNSKETIELCKQFPYTYAVVGIHPNDAWNEQLVYELEKYIDDSVVAIGEVGLDFHYQDSPSKEMQKKVFDIQVELAYKNNIPVIVHSRDAHIETYEAIKEYKQKYPSLDFVLHSYSSGSEYVDKYVELGVYFSFSGIVTFKNAKDMKEAAKKAPLDLIFCETDTPYLTPEPHRGKMNLPEYVIYVCDYIADLKGISKEKMLDSINNNVKKVFKKAI